MGEAAIILLSANLRQKENHGEIILKLRGTNRYNPKNLHHVQLFGSGNIAQIGTVSLKMYCFPGLTFLNADKAFSEALLSRS